MSYLHRSLKLVPDTRSENWQDQVGNLLKRRRLSAWRFNIYGNSRGNSSALPNPNAVGRVGKRKPGEKRERKSIWADQRGAFIQSANFAIGDNSFLCASMYSAQESTHIKPSAFARAHRPDSKVWNGIFGWIILACWVMRDVEWKKAAWQRGTFAGAPVWPGFSLLFFSITEMDSRGGKSVSRDISLNLQEESSARSLAGPIQVRRRWTSLRIINWTLELSHYAISESHSR